MTNYMVAFAAVAAGCFAGDPLAQPAINAVTPLPRPSHPSVTLVSNGVPRFVIAWDHKSEDGAPRGMENRPIREAVRTLRREFHFCTGEDVEVVDVSDPVASDGRPVMLVGRSARTDALGIDPARLPPEGFVVTTFSNGVAIVGNDSSLSPGTEKEGPRRATLWGAYDFLERFLGCRYYYPGPDGSVRPACTNLAVASCAYTDAPRFRNRSGHFQLEIGTAIKTLGTTLVRANLRDWRAASRLAQTVSFTAMHSPEPRAWAQEHPEWLELSFMRAPDGRLYHSTTNHMGNYFDVTNLKFADALVEGLVRDDTPVGRRKQGFAFNDDRTVVFGQCDSFRTLEEMRENPVVQKEGLITDANVELGPYGYFSDIYGRFYQHLAKRVNERLPERRIILMPYAGCTYSPTQERFRHLPDNVELGVCFPKVPRFIRNTHVRELVVRELHRWSEVIGGRPVQQLWTYNAFNGPFEQAVANEFLPETIAAFGRDLGDVEIKVGLDLYPVQVPGQCVAFHFYYGAYCAFRAMWDGARFNPDAALDEHWTLFYGEEAGAHLRELHRVLKEAFLAHSVKEVRVRMLYPVETLERIETELNAARKILSRDKKSPEWRRFKLMSNPLVWELDRQRKRHVTPEKRKEVYFISGEN